MSHLHLTAIWCMVALRRPIPSNQLTSCIPVFLLARLRALNSVSIYSYEGWSRLTAPPSQEETGLPSGWEVRHSNSKNLPYYFNAAEKISRWEPPSSTDTEKLKRYMAQHHSSTVAGASVAKPADKIRAAHLLVKHRDSRRPASWRESEITRTKEEAMDIIKGHESRIKRGDISLGDLAITESDCSSARKRGDLGYFGKGDMQKEFEEAAFALQPGQMSGVVATASGLHLIERLE
ncbi:hypothetical protein BX600DRAFT_508679 [Xylariales sp. PMI_506]|nr:hypothetical protein BX600DRAFT_508679 [Xylariales sp. PMI_506]